MRIFVTPWTIACQAPLSMWFPRQEYWDWVAILFSRGSSWPRGWTQVSCITGRFFTIWATREDAIYKPHGTHKSKICNRFIYNWKSNSNITVKSHQVTREESKTRIKESKNCKSNLQTVDKMAINTINNYFKGWWSKCSNQKTDWPVFVWMGLIVVIILKCTEIANQYIVYQELT